MYFLVTLIRKKRDKEENLVQNGLHLLQDVTHSEVNQQSETAENHEDGESAAHSDYLFPSDCESSNFSVMDGTFELNIEEHRLQDDLVSDYSLPSDSESSDGSILEESFERHQKGNKNEDISDSLASDDDYEGEDEEDSLIEINLPHFPEFDEDPKQKLQSNLADSIFKQQGLMELLAEFNDMNEDENLIEIDISMGMQISD